MIIQIRGTSGSGKTTVMRKVMEGLAGGSDETAWVPHYKEGRKQPLYYRRGGIVVLGHYEATCGGCDTIGSAADVAKLITEVSYLVPTIVLCEGLLLSEDTKWTMTMDDPKILFLTTPLERCLEQIRQRRRNAGNEKPLNPANTSNRVRTIERARTKLLAAGVPCFRASPEQAPGVILKWIREAAT